ncbi:MAG: glycerol-3-phosphate dehydrogenase (NAD(P)+) [Candidatus Saganbacteria bacterium]|uniref:Glycerol-3-phosphate dehydrogenase [NAD(P)+] n=1 Tax=Candidatus Saganbacteria bacterium TaxID=2575572 RepID=A0A833L0Y2_UNCSA|nr:MAG: glycerol-3-phosphate dehydrogenase (NAD(P)+) [Candidatus Saganbacteria bacterium]
MVKMAKISVFGAGAWGTTLSILLSENKNDVALWSYEADVAEDILKFRENKKYLPGFQLPAAISPTQDIKSAVIKTNFIILAVPTQFLRGIIEKITKDLSEEALILSASKGIEEKTLKLPLTIISEYYKGNISAISGPNLAKEIAKGLPAAAVIASKEISSAKKFQSILNSERFRVYTNDDIIGVQLGGALKNVIAIAAGIADGFTLGDNAKSALLIRGMAEITRLGISLGAKAQTFSGLAGMGDLITTCSSNLSRNHHVGLELAKGKKLNEILALMKDIAEGVPTCRAAITLAKQQNIEIPITFEVYQILFEGKDPYKAITSLMKRSPTSE